MNRHHLIYLQANETFRFLDTSLAVSIQQKIHQMIEQNIPFTVCRQESVDYFKVAVSCFIDGRKYRVALALDTVPVQSHKPPLLSVIAENLDTQTQALLQAFIQKMEQMSCSVQVYGSYANQYLYKENFVHAQSDLDLLIEVNEMNKLPQIIQAIEQLKIQISITIDGEIALPTAQNFSFNELIFALNHQQDTLIVKELYEIRLQKIAEILGGNLYELQQYRTCPA
ncbi:malonate decarboxylase holo-[acyl-carrier-protein] synthase [Acinetobacter sp. WCHAc060033]|uniref:malonate decarboxylase holo-[acyl-carrier-protein] synthase n=1 Tax=Acinetobacter sp. WCHAc060033 TaxID=2518624 RepID=UPI001023D5DC|nr:malonate decarboxylase holo-[acyl-carrier-protein] synthase [Acinetobacter sp. WCHAc060033]RZG87034.1 malonate decarboxylase holo-[acyl-carrier-protein] synthase [Acinetobacter sp. WCHAc060033]